MLSLGSTRSAGDAPAPVPDSLFLDDLESWREKILAVLLRLLFWFGLGAAAPTIWLAAREGALSIVAVAACALLIVLALQKGPWGYTQRSFGLAVLSYGLGTFFLARVGPSIGLVYLITFPMLAALLLGFIPAVAALVLNALTLFGIGYSVYPTLYAPGFSDLPLLKWLVLTANFAFVNGSVTLAMALLVRQLDRSLQRVRHEHSRLLAETHDRERAQAEVRQLNATLEERIEDRTRELQAANRELEAFAYAVSHDLRSPLSTLGGFSAQLARHVPPGDEKAQHYIQRVRVAVNQMGDLIDALLALSRASRDAMQQQAVDLAGIATDLLARYREADPHRKVEVHVQPGMHAVGDARLLRDVLDNLLGNAWKFTALRSDARIEFTEEVLDSGEVAFVVRDNGVGFDMAHAGKLFQAFYRLHRPVEFPGTGIGLATVHRIVSRHGGRIWAESSPGDGAVFRFTLGRRPVEDAPPPR